MENMDEKSAHSSSSWQLSKLHAPEFYRTNHNNFRTFLNSMPNKLRLSLWMWFESIRFVSIRCEIWKSSFSIRQLLPEYNLTRLAFRYSEGHIVQFVWICFFLCTMRGCWTRTIDKLADNNRPTTKFAYVTFEWKTNKLNLQFTTTLRPKSCSNLLLRNIFAFAAAEEISGNNWIYIFNAIGDRY